MFIVNLTYIKDLKIIEQYVEEHRNYIQACVDKGFVVMAGPKDPRDGGVIVVALDDRAQLDKLLQQDPYWIHNLVSYDIIRFKPIRHCPELKALINKSESNAA